MKSRVCNAILVAVLAIGCGAGTPATPSAPPRVPPAAPYDGRWTGQTDQAQKVTFSIAGNQITSLDFNWVSSPSNPPCDGAGGFGGGGVLGTVSDNAFTVVNPFMTSSPRPTWALSGTFTSPATAIGTLDVTFAPTAVDPGFPCPVSMKTGWSAQRESGT
jgi:hypothetical protein